ncbi:hypothetical protein REPUB_Repub17cG0094300 [Reevesia pubescens]
MVSAKNAMLILTIIAPIAICLGAVYRIGDASGWHPMFDYKKFEYNAILHNVKEKVDIYVHETSSPSPSPVPANSHPMPSSPAAQNSAPTSVSTTNNDSSFHISSHVQIATKFLAMVVLAYFL